MLFRSTPQTDVYLLGAILYEILSGDPPHVADRLMDILKSVMRSQLKLPKEAPTELGEIALKALRPKAEDRYESAEALRLSLVSFLEHRGSLQLSKVAAKKSTQMQQLMDFNRHRPSISDSEHERIYRLFGEARFGFRQALRTWPNNRRARRELNETVEAMVRYELSLGDPRTASLLLKEVEKPSEELIAEVAKAKKEAEARQAELEQLNRDHDPARGRRSRVLVLGTLGATWILLPIFAGIAQLTGAVDMSQHSTAGLFWGSFVLVALIVGTIRRERIKSSPFNRRAALVVLLALSAMPLSHLAAWFSGQSAQETLNHHFMIWFSILAMMTIYADRRLWLSALAYLLGFLSSSFIPDTGYFAAGLGHAAFIASVIFLNMPVMHLSVEGDDEEGGLSGELPLPSTSSASFEGDSFDLDQSLDLEPPETDAPEQRAPIKVAPRSVLPPAYPSGSNTTGPIPPPQEDLSEQD